MRVVLIMLFLAPVLTYGQEWPNGAKTTARLGYYLNAYNHADGASGDVQLVISFVDKLQKKSFKRDDEFLAYVFQKIHQRFLQQYAINASFGQLLTDRTYNCLTATALYAILLDHFGFDYKVIETNYHIFLIAQTSQGPVLVETTDPANGYVSDPKEIEKRIALYRENRIHLGSSNKTYYRFKFDLYNEVNLDQMLGLLYYNLSVNAYNQQSLSLAIEQLKNASKLYHSPRIDEFSKIILLSVIEGAYDEHLRKEYLRSLQALRTEQFRITASSN